jgi:hypothetical protein
MPLASTLPLSAHFTYFYLGEDKPEANDRIITNLRYTAAGLERQRSVLNSRLLVNSTKHRNRGFRTEAENESVGGSQTSDHVEGLSADYTALDFPDGMPEAYKRLRDSDIGSFDQIIFYPAANYIHAGFGGNRREFRVKLFEGTGGTPLIGSDFIQTLGGSVVYAAKANPVGSIVLLAATVLFLVAVTDK